MKPTKKEKRQAKQKDEARQSAEARGADGGSFTKMAKKRGERAKKRADKKRGGKR